MDVTNVNPGLIFWTLLNFALLLFILKTFAWKPILNALHERESSISDALTRAEQATMQANKLLKESDDKLASAQQEMMHLIRDGRNQAAAQLQSALEEAENIKSAKIAEATAEIEREKDSAMQSLRSEVASLVISATERILRDKIDVDYQMRVVDSLINDIPSKN